MAIPKKGSRLITIGNAVYRFLITIRSNKVEVIAELENSPAQRLHIITSLESGTAFTPAMMKRCIESALEKGWKPDQKGKEFVFSADETTFSA